MKFVAWFLRGATWLSIGSGLLVCIVGVIGIVVRFTVDFDAPSDAARPAVEALTDDSVYVDPAVRDTFDASAARRVIGDRSIVVGVFPAGRRKQAGELCEEIVWRRSLAIGLVYAGTPAPVVCGGRYAESPAGVTAGEWGRQILLAADLARLVTAAPADLNTGIAGYVSAYDVAVAGDLWYGRPPREVKGGTGTWGDVVGVMVAMAIGVLMLFLGLMVFGGRLTQYFGDRRRRRVEHAEVRSQLSAVATALDTADRTAAPDAFTEAVRAYASAQDVYRRANGRNHHLWAQADLRRAAAAIDEMRAASRREGAEP